MDTIWARVILGMASLVDHPSTVVSKGTPDEAGFIVHSVKSEYQSGRTDFRVLLPEKIEKDREYSVVFVLPVEAGREKRYGDGLAEVKKNDLHNKFTAVFVAPSFSHLPWYADHPTKTDIRQESYLLQVVLPFVDKTYPVNPKERYLLGFSKSGWGAFSLILRHPSVFHKAASWDAPLMMEKPGLYGSGDIFATAENFADYHLSKLLARQAEHFQKEKRLVLTGYGNFREQQVKAHELLRKLKIAHDYRDGPKLKHDWHSGWVSEAVELLFAK